jgi:hypothetical protein
MFPFKVQLFQGFKSETEPINTKSVVQHVIRYQVLLLSFNMFVRLHNTHINRLFSLPDIVGGILQSVFNFIQCVKVLRCLINNL